MKRQEYPVILWNLRLVHRKLRPPPSALFSVLRSQSPWNMGKSTTNSQELGQSIYQVQGIMMKDVLVLYNVV